MGVMQAACAITRSERDEGSKETDGTKKNVRGIQKLLDATTQAQPTPFNVSCCCVREIQLRLV